jgi:hypothetical protein
MISISVIDPRVPLGYKIDLTGYKKKFNGSSSKKKQKERVEFFFSDRNSKNILLPRYYLPPEYIRCHPKCAPFPMNAEWNSAWTLQETPERPQKSAFLRTTRAIQKNMGATLVLTPGSGKTVIAIKIACHLKQKTMILVHSNLLMNQWIERLVEMIPSLSKSNIGIIKGNTFTIEGCDFVVASVKTIHLRSYPEGKLRCGLLIVDETHHICCETFIQSTRKIEFRYSLGLTGTPYRGDGLGKFIFYLIGSTSFEHKVPPNPSVQVNFIAWGSSPSGKKRIPCNQFSRMVTMITRNKQRNNVIISLINRIHQRYPLRKGLLLSERTSHLIELHKRLNDLNISNNVKTGSVDTDDRKQKTTKRIKRCFDGCLGMVDLHCVLTNKLSKLIDLRRYIFDTSNESNLSQTLLCLGVERIKVDEVSRTLQGDVDEGKPSQHNKKKRLHSLHWQKWKKEETRSIEETTSVSYNN